MKRSKQLGSLLILCVFLILPATTSAQQNKIRLSLKASVMQRIGVNTDITIDYSRPGVKGRKIWGGLVPYGMAPGNQESKGKPFPWRAGANENTTIEFSKDVLVEGHHLAAGKYGLFMLPGKKDWVIIFSKDNSAWGSFSYNKADDALRITVKPVEAPHMEWLMYGFDRLAGTSAVAYLWWDNLKVPFKISLPKE